MRAVVFDFDGVLVDSEPLHFRALRDCLSGEGVAIDEAEYTRDYLAYNDREALRLALERHGIAPEAGLISRLAAEKARRFATLLSDVPFFPGAPELIRSLAAAMPIAIASGALRNEIEKILERSGLRSLFTTIVGADDVSYGKPHPEPYEAALYRLRAHHPELTPTDCLVFEDSMAGIASARAAGMRVVAITNSYAAERLAAAHHVITTLDGLTVDRARALHGSATVLAATAP